jgi:sugar phosphate isomerase/epimerase
MEASVKQDKYSVIISNFGNRADRFLSGYGEDRTFGQLCDSAARVPGLSGVEIVGTWHITTANVAEVKTQLEEHNLKLVSIIPDHFASHVYRVGAFTAKDSRVRARAVADTKAMMDIASELGCDLINVWNGQDGYDYPFQADYLQERDWLVEGIRDCARHRGDVRVSLEYKLKEPRNRSYIGTAGGALLVAQEVGLPNVGVTIDVGHALAAYEDVGESVAILGRAGNKMFHMHFNDNYRLWDDDMIVGSVHTIEYLELLYWLDRIGYEGFLSLDQYPYREEPEEAITESILWLQAMRTLVERMGHDRITEVIRGGNAAHAQRLVREAMMNAR